MSNDNPNEEQTQKNPEPAQEEGALEIIKNSELSFLDEVIDLLGAIITKT